MKDDIDQEIFRLAQLDPSDCDECGYQVIDYFVLNSLAQFLLT